MEPLKLTTLVILIPFGLLLSESAAAYPEPLNQIDGTDTTCVLRMVSPPELEEKNDKLHALLQVVVDLIAPTDTPPLDQDQEAHAHTCR
ncbi:MAG: hypothetical protein ABJC64_12135, partial [Paracoccaceae bacterium]